MGTHIFLKQISRINVVFTLDCYNECRRNNIMNNKRILPSIGLEGTKEELLEFLSDFEINKIAISFVGNQMIFTTSVPVDDELMEVYKQAYRINEV